MYDSKLPMPKDRITQDQLKVFSNKVELTIDNVYWGYMLNSSSMDPLIDQGTLILTIKPDSPEDIAVGDIICFRSNFTIHNIAHRVVNISSEEEGIYFVTKGDNNPTADPIKVRFKDVVAVVVAILY
jgi:signal peptidase I